MALDYSKLSDEELQAIANDDYTKLSDKTLRILSRDSTAKVVSQPSAQSVLGGTESSANKVASRAALADTLLNAVTSTWDLAARVPATAYHYATGPKGETFGQAYERAAEEVARTAPIKPDLVGRTLGITNTPQYSGALQRRAAEAIAPVIQENVIQPVAQATGLPEGAVADIGAIASIPLAGPTGRAVTTVAKPVVGAVKSTGGAVRDVASGAYGTFTGKTAAPGVVPEPWQQASVRQPVGKTYYTPEEIAAWRAGELTTEQLTPQPIQNLGPQALSALQKTEGNVPYAGQGFRAFGEQLGETYRNPLNLLTDVGLDVLTGGGLPTAGRLAYKGVKGAQGARAAKTLEGAGFTPLYAEELAALQGNLPHPSALGPIRPAGSSAGFPIPETAPLLTYTPAGQTAMPMPGPGRRVNIEGESFNLPYEINTSSVQGARPQQTAGPVIPPPEAAPATTTPQPKALTVTETAGKTAEQLAADQEILNLINSRRGIVANDPVANRQNFASQIEQTRQQLEFAREQNKQMFGDRAKAMNERAGEGSMTPSQKDMITDATAVRYMINQTTQSAVKQQGKKVSYSEPQLNEMATQAGITLDWKTAPDISNMGVAEARKAINKWMFDSIDAQSPELGLKTRKESLRAQERRAERESAGQPEATLSAEETEALRKRQEKLLGKQPEAKPTTQYASAAEMRKALYGKMPNDELEALVNKTFPSVNTLREKMSRSKSEETKATDESLRQRLEAIKAQGKSRGPKDAMEMIAGENPTFPSRQAFEEQQLMDKLAGKITTGSFVDNGLRYEITAIDYGNVPRQVLEGLNKPLTQVRVFSEKTNKQISGPAIEPPAKSLRQQVEDKLKKRK